MAIFYIDYENVQSLGLEGIEKLSKKDEVIVFYSKYSNSIKIELVEAMIGCKAKLNFIHVSTGHTNALDFKLITALFCNLKSSKEYVIISKDKGYDSAIDMGKVLGRNNIRRESSIIEYLQTEEVSVKTPDILLLEKNEIEETSSEVEVELITDNTTQSFEYKKVLPNIVKQSETVEDKIKYIIYYRCGLQLSPEHISLVITGVKNCQDRSSFYQYFRTKLGQETGRDFYMQIRNEFEDFRDIVTSK